MLPIILNYSDYRQYLKDFYNTKKSLKKEYSYRVFTRLGDLKSPSHLKMIMDGQRNLTASTIQKYIIALNLTNEIEKLYFETLVLQNQSKDLDLKKKLDEKLYLLRKKALQQYDPKTMSSDASESCAEQDIQSDII